MLAWPPNDAITFNLNGRRKIEASPSKSMHLKCNGRQARKGATLCVGSDTLAKLRDLKTPQLLERHHQPKAQLVSHLESCRTVVNTCFASTDARLQHSTGE
jgi:hypothetical protein